MNVKNIIDALNQNALHTKEDILKYDLPHPKPQKETNITSYTILPKIYHNKYYIIKKYTKQQTKQPHCKETRWMSRYYVYKLENNQITENYEEYIKLKQAKEWIQQDNETNQ